MPDAVAVLSIQTPVDLLEDLPDAFWSFDANWCFTYLNRRAERFLGGSRAELLGRNVWQCFPQAVGTLSYLELQRAMRERQVVEFETFSPPSQQRLAMKAYPHQGGLMVYMRDVPTTDPAAESLEHAVEALRRSEERFRLALQNSGVTVFTQDADLRYTWIHKPAPGTYAYDILGRTDFEINPPEQAEQLAAMKRQVLESGTGIRQELRLVMANQPRAYDLRIEPFQDGQGLAGVITTAIDITERKQAEQNLQAARALLERTIAALDDAVFVVDSASRTVLTCNPAVERLFGYRPDEVVGRNTAFLHVSPEAYAEFGRLLFAALDRDGIFRHEFQMRRRSGEVFFSEHTVTELRDEHGKRTGVVSVVRDITERKRTEKVQRFLAEATQALAASLDYRETLDRVCRLAVPLLADYCFVGLLNGDTLEMAAGAHADPRQEPALTRFRDLYHPHMEDGGLHPQVLRSGKCALVPEISPEAIDRLATEEERQIIRSLGPRSMIVAPLIAHDEIIGVFTLVRTTAGARYDTRDQEMVEELARRAAAGVDHARLYRAQQQAQQESNRALERVTLLQSVTAALSQALTPAEVAQVLVDRGVAAMGAQFGVVALRTGDGSEFEIVAHCGFQAGEMQPWTRFPAKAGLPIPDAVSHGEPIWIESHEDYKTRYPVFADLAERRGGGAAVVLPIGVGNQAEGGIFLRFAEARTFSASERGFIISLVHQCAQALQRARLYRAEEMAHRRADFLAEASRTLASSLDYESTLQAVANLMVPSMADFCVVDVMVDVIEEQDETRTVRRVASPHADPAKREIARALALLPAELDEPGGIAEVLRTGQPVLIPHVPVTYVSEAFRRPERARLAQELGMRSMLIVPLIVQARTIGAITLISTRPDCIYGAEDLDLAEELARRAATAVENARLYRQAQEATRLRDQFLSIASHELKTPLTSVLGYLQLIRKRAERDGTLSERDRRSLQIVIRQSHQLDRLITALLDFSRLQSGRLSLDRAPLDVCAVVRRVVDEIQPNLEIHTVHCCGTNEPIFIDGDGLRLEQVLLNLVQNAIKYSPEGGPVEIDVGLQDGQVSIAVRDQGVGIPAAALPHIFEQFYRAPNVDPRAISGMGIGLYVVQEIISLHGGTVEVESQEGRGTTFTVRLPVLSH